MQLGDTKAAVDHCDEVQIIAMGIGVMMQQLPSEIGAGKLQAVVSKSVDKVVV